MATPASDHATPHGGCPENSRGQIHCSETGGTPWPHTSSAGCEPPHLGSPVKGSTKPMPGAAPDRATGTPHTAATPPTPATQPSQCGAAAATTPGYPGRAAAE